MMDRLHFNPKGAEIGPSPSEVLYDAMEKESRIFDASIAFVEGSPNYLDPQEISQTLAKYFELNPTAVPTLNNDLQGKGPQIEVVDANAKKITKAQRSAKIVVLNGIVQGLVPKDIIDMFPDAGIFVENTPEGINISGDHFALDALQISPIVINLLTQCRLVEQPDCEVTISDRQPHSRIVNASRTNATNLFIAAAEVSKEMRGENSFLYVPQITQPNDRITPIPVAIGNILDETTRASTIADLTNRDKLMAQTPIGEAISRSRLDAFPKGLVSMIYKLGIRFAPVKLLPNVGGLVSCAPPVSWKRSTGTVNPDVGSQVKSIGLNLEMFPKKWRVPLVLAITGTLPTSTGTKIFNTISVTGTEDALLDEFSERLSAQLREL